MTQQRFYFCESCGKRLTGTDLERGGARDKQVKGVYCQECGKNVTTLSFDSYNEQQALDFVRQMLLEKDPNNPALAGMAVEPPGFIPRGGQYRGAVKVAISTPTQGAEIYFTDGAVPSKETPQYTGPITITATTVLRAVAFRNGIYSRIHEEQFVILPS